MSNIFEAKKNGSILAKITDAGEIIDVNGIALSNLGKIKYIEHFSINGVSNGSVLSEKTYDTDNIYLFVGYVSLTSKLREIHAHIFIGKPGDTLNIVELANATNNSIAISLSSQKIKVQLSNNRSYYDGWIYKLV